MRFWDMNAFLTPKSDNLFFRQIILQFLQLQLQLQLSLALLELHQLCFTCQKGASCVIRQVVEHQGACDSIKGSSLLFLQPDLDF